MNSPDLNGTILLLAGSIQMPRLLLYPWPPHPPHLALHAETAAAITEHNHGYVSPLSTPKTFDFAAQITTASSSW